MKFFVTFLLAVAMASAADVPCEKVHDVTWDALDDQRLRTCDMTGKTRINTVGTRISWDHDNDVKGLKLRDNRKIEYLPDDVGGKFPNLIAYDASHCALKVISQENFEDLLHLRLLRLNHNHIESIDGDLFAHSLDLELIFLNSNEIKKIDGNPFAVLHKLTHLDMNDNACIDHSYEQTEMSRLSDDLQRKCHKNHDHEHEHM